MDLSDESNCEGVTHTCDPAVKFSCRDSGEDAFSYFVLQRFRSNNFLKVSVEVAPL